MTMSHAACCVGVASLAAVGIAVHVSAAAGPDADAAAALEHFLDRPTELHEYRAARRLDASGSGQRGWLEVDISFSVASGLQYAVTDEGGSGYIRNRVLRSLLEEERRVIVEARMDAVAISEVNYAFHPEAIDEAGLAVVRIEPRRKERALINGRMFLTTSEGDLVRVEGVLAKNPSIWISRTTVTRSYRRIDGALMPVSLDTTAQLRLLGSSALRMTYQYAEIDERPVAGEP